MTSRKTNSRWRAGEIPAGHVLTGQLPLTEPTFFTQTFKVIYLAIFSLGVKNKKEYPPLKKDTHTRHPPPLHTRQKNTPNTGMDIFIPDLLISHFPIIY